MTLRSVFAYVPYQFCGHVPEFLKDHSERLCLFWFETRFGKCSHRVEWIEDGRVVLQRTHRSSHNIFLYYFLWFFWGQVELWRFAAAGKLRTVALCGHPANLFLSSVHRLFHRVAFSYWIGDFFPSKSLVIRAFERVKKFYNDHVGFAYYLSDAINRVENGRVMSSDVRRTVAWGIRLYPECKVSRRGLRQLLFVGLLRNGQGIEDVISFVAKNPDYRLAIIGEAANGYDREIRRVLASADVGGRVFFPNRFYSQDELIAEARRSFAGIALYDLSPDNFTHYADPGKVKAYIEMGLPVIMTRISDVAKIIEEFKAGVVIDSPAEVGSAASEIGAHVDEYGKGVSAFAEHYDYDRYYAENFKAMERLWK